MTNSIRKMICSGAPNSLHPMRGSVTNSTTVDCIWSIRTVSAITSSKCNSNGFGWHFLARLFPMHRWWNAFTTFAIGPNHKWKHKHFFQPKMIAHRGLDGGEWIMDMYIEHTHRVCMECEILFDIGIRQKYSNIKFNADVDVESIWCFMFRCPQEKRRTRRRRRRGRRKRSKNGKSNVI